MTIEFSRLDMTIEFSRLDMTIEFSRLDMTIEISRLDNYMLLSSWLWNYIIWTSVQMTDDPDIGESNMVKVIWARVKTYMSVMYSKL